MHPPQLPLVKLIDGCLPVMLNENKKFPLTPLMQRCKRENPIPKGFMIAKFQVVLFLVLFYPANHYSQKILNQQPFEQLENDEPTAPNVIDATKKSINVFPKNQSVQINNETQMIIACHITNNALCNAPSAYANDANRHTDAAQDEQDKANNLCTHLHSCLHYNNDELQSIWTMYAPGLIKSMEEIHCTRSPTLCITKLPNACT